MPLDRAHVTIASRVMLPAYPALAAVLGLVWVLTPRASLRQTPLYVAMDDLASMPAWGSVFLGIAATLAVALVGRSRRTYELGLAVLLVWLLGLGACFGYFAFTGASTFAAVAWPLFGATACWASLLSLFARES